MSGLARVARGAGRLIDSVIRRKSGIFTYSQDPACFLRISFATARSSITPATAVVVGKGDPIVEIHLWNERMEGRAIGLTLARDLRRSLEELAIYLERVDPDARYVAIHGSVGFVGGDDARRLTAILARFGFEVGPSAVAGWRPWRGRFWEAFFSRWLLYSFNPRASRRQRLGELARFDIWLTRAEIGRLYGRDGYCSIDGERSVG